MAEKSEIVIIVMFLMSLFHPQKVAFIWDGKDPPQGDAIPAIYSIVAIPEEQCGLRPSILPKYSNRAIWGTLNNNRTLEKFNPFMVISILLHFSTLMNNQE